MKYALLIYTPTSADDYATAEAVARTAAGGPWVDYTRAAKDAGVLVAAEQLTHAETATSVRVRDGERLITDGPFMETKDHLLGFYLVDVADLDTALDWAARMPAIPGATIEVRSAMSGLGWQKALD
jgi:hypothetical protein